MRIAHLSDLHFSKITFSPAQFFSKRWVGNINLLLSRRRAFDTRHLSSLVPLFKQLQVDHIVITGDLTTTSLEGEFEQAAELIASFEKEGITSHILPGNHDHYTQGAHQNHLFYRYFPSPLKEKRVAKTCLGKGWWLITLDTALATSLISSRGEFAPAIEQELKTVLGSIPPTEKIILANHFPLFNNDGPRKVLSRAGHLRTLISEFPQIVLYLHGHTHRQCIADLRFNHLPILLESGSCTYKKHSSWHLIDIQNKELQIQVFHHHAPGEWRITKQQSLGLL